MKKLRRVFILWSFFFSVWPYAFADSGAELQWVFCEDPLPDVVTSLGLPQPRKRTTQEIFYLETLNKDFELHKIFVKFKRRPNKKVKSSVKVHYLNEVDIPLQYKNNPSIECEKDIYVDVVRWGCAVKGENASYALSSEQLQFLVENGVDQGHLKDAYLLGPLSGRASEVTDEIEFEELYTPSGLAVGELSVRTELTKAEAEQISWNDRLATGGVNLCRLQSGKRQVVFEDLWRSHAYTRYNFE